MDVRVIVVGRSHVDIMYDIMTSVFVLCIYVMYMCSWSMIPQITIIKKSLAACLWLIIDQLSLFNKNLMKIVREPIHGWSNHKTNVMYVLVFILCYWWQTKYITICKIEQETLTFMQDKLVIGEATTHFEVVSFTKLDKWA